VNQSDRVDTVRVLEAASWLDTGLVGEGEEDVVRPSNTSSKLSDLPGVGESQLADFLLLEVRIYS
jgi:hypothetical protein